MLTTRHSGSSCGSDSPRLAPCEASEFIVPQGPLAEVSRHRMLAAAAASSAGMPPDSGAYLGIDNRPLQVQLLREAWGTWTHRGSVNHSWSDVRQTMCKAILRSVNEALVSGCVTQVTADAATSIDAIDRLLEHWGQWSDSQLEQSSNQPDQLLFATGIIVPIGRWPRNAMKSRQIFGTYAALAEAFPHLLDNDGKFLVVVPTVMAEYVAERALTNRTDIGQWAGDRDTGDDATVLRLALRLWNHECEGDLRFSSEALATARSIVAP